MTLDRAMERGGDDNESGAGAINNPPHNPAVVDRGNPAVLRGNPLRNPVVLVDLGGEETRPM
jgi:hypothetical protein